MICGQVWFRNAKKQWLSANSLFMVAACHADMVAVPVCHVRRQIGRNPDNRPHPVRKRDVSRVG